jgi:hypothetical protein
MTLTQINKAGLDEIALDHVFTIGASGSSAYTFQGEGLNGTVNNPTLYLTRGKTYRFENGSGGHPIRIQSTSGASGTAYNTGVTNNAGSGTVIVEVQHDAPDVLYYQCTSHAAMNGILYITGALADGGVTTAKIADQAVTTAKLANQAVDYGKLATDAVITSKIADSNVTTAKIADDAVTGAKIADTTVDTNNIVNNSVTTVKLADQAVTLDKLPHGTSSNDGKFLRANNGADPTFETVSGTTINNNADNKIITGSGTANTLEAESLAQIDSDGDLWIGHAPTTHYDNRKVFIHQPTAGETAYLSITGEQGAGIVFGDSVGQNTGNYESIIWHNNSNDTLQLTTDNGNKGIKIENGGDIEVIDGNIKFASGHGIDFSATGNGGATMQNELLDDYEEGTFTPTLRGNNTNSSPVISGSGKYTKVGRLVHVWISFQNKNQTYLPSGEYIQVHGLPYTIGGGTQVAPYGMNYKIGFSTNYQYFWFVASGGTKIWGYYNSNAAAYQPWGTDQWKTAGPIYHENSFVYMID